MINMYEVSETNKMIEHENLDVRTITLGISLLDCIDSDLDQLNQNIYNKITTVAKDLVSTGQDIEKEFGIPIVNKRISITPVSLVGGSACKTPEDYVTIARTLDKAAEALGINADGVLIGSTGVIGKQLPIDRIVAGVKALAEKKNDTLANGTEAAKAIMTTDTCEKQIAVEIEVAGKTVTIGGMAKGSGMIHPNMCTMLSFITTDAAITKEALQKALSDDVNDTYNMISVDGDTSTNDSVVLLANGMAENEVITVDSESYKTFAEALHEINEYLAKKIAGDGEGATALFEVTVVGADTKETAKTLAKSIVCSNLTKAAIAGHDANWGRILCAMGYSGAQFDPEKVDLFFESKAGKIQIIENGTAVDYSEEKATEILSQEEVKAVADVKMGSESATAWGCDLTHGYIDINADYRS